MDIDEIERVEKYWFGDHATWSHEQLLRLVVSVPLIPPHELSRFANYATTGLLPDGTRTSPPPMTMEELGLLHTPSHRWAECPTKIKDTSCQDALSPLFGVPYKGTDLSVPPYAQFPARLLPLQAKLWQGMAPMNRNRWLQRQMGDPANYRNLMELINDILAIFKWWNEESVQHRMRAGFNFLVDKHVEFAVPVNDRREKNGVPQKLDLVAMWAEYFYARISAISERTHQWLVDRVDEVQSRAFAEYTATLESAGDDQQAVGAAGKKLYECVQDLNAMITKVDYTLGIPMTGFKGHKASSNASVLSLDFRDDLYQKLAATKSWTHMEKMLKAQDAEAATEQKPPKDISELVAQMKKGPQPAAPRFQDQETLIAHYHEGRRNRAEIRSALRGAPAPPADEQWIAILKGRMDFYIANGRDSKTHQWGFVCYRLTYNQTDTEWADFMAKLRADMDNSRSGEWIQGFDSIADRAGLEMYDGRDLGIAEGDIEAAKKHFKETYTMLPTLGRMWAQDFLVIDAQSYSSYAHPEPEIERPPVPFGPCFGDKGGFVRLVDTIEYPAGMLDAMSPGYQGELKVLSSLVFTEVYPLLATFALRPTSLWPLARLHPREVYVGNTIDSQEAWWEFCRIDTVAMMDGIFADLRKKKAALREK
ncbi:hypothetical protein HBI56_047090 [Parastagonospora nodorum]|nr:hypothetical protein HBH70_153380 [Parastagonospora nodorum]KAH5312256.1 hypothetical protein HBI12_141810 [Parastagonospora nodorum]KAH6537344.1 hypothetical protein HBI56_047090 [Parastagonospora nodorum]